MATVVREREHLQAVSNGRVRERYVDATMTREAREARIAWRLEHLAAWQHDLETLEHFDPDYPYDVAHEYDYDWTTDPDYGAEGVHFSEFEEDGVLIDDDSRPGWLQEHMLATARDRIGRRTMTEATYVFLPQQVAHLKLTTRQGSPVDRVKPDLVVMPSEADLLEANDPSPGRTAQLDDAVPELVLEVLSKTTAARDLDAKRRLYETLGVGEYLVYDLGGKRGPDSARELLMYRLVDGAYEAVAPLKKSSASEPDTVWSDVFDTHIRFLPDARQDAEEFRPLPQGHRPAPRFQWYDPEEGRWRDTETDAEHERNRIVQERDQAAQERDQVAQERDQAAQERDQAAQERDQAAQERDQATQERTDMAIDMMREFLGSELEPEHLDRIEEVWREDGPPTDAARRVRTVLQSPPTWRSLLGGPV
ncbi:MAG: Uma2 family endonuclease [Caldilineaceae bacterium]|nr:Uma2 family endonuclease [Caldilineaceae bacterium]